MCTQKVKSPSLQTPSASDHLHSPEAYLPVLERRGYGWVKNPVQWTSKPLRRRLTPQRDLRFDQPWRFWKGLKASGPEFLKAFFLLHIFVLQAQAIGANLGRSKLPSQCCPESISWIPSPCFCFQKVRGTSGIWGAPCTQQKDSHHTTSSSRGTQGTTRSTKKSSKSSTSLFFSSWLF